MTPTHLTGDPTVDDFLCRFALASSSKHADAHETLFADTFLAGDAHGARSVARDDFLAALPKRAAMAAAAGLSPAVLVSADAHRIDDNWCLVQTIWHAGRSSGDPLVMRASYLLHTLGGDTRIAVYINHEGLPLRPPASSG